MRLQIPLPDDYTLASPDELAARIGTAKEALGDRLLVLAYHYHWCLTERNALLHRPQLSRRR